jgi:hypothetical protein
MEIVLVSLISAFMIHDSGMATFYFGIDSQIIKSSEYEQTVYDATFSLSRSELPALHILGHSWQPRDDSYCGD